MLSIKGGPSFHWLTDTATSHTVVRDEGGWYTYADLNASGYLVATRKYVGLADPGLLGLRSDLVPPISVQQSLSKFDGQRNDNAQNDILSSFVRRRLQDMSTIPNLVVPIRWSDHEDRTMPSVDDLTALMNHVGPTRLCPTGSVRDVYLHASYNKVQIDSFVVPWITSDHTEDYYASGSSGLSYLIWRALKHALDQLDNDNFDFTNFDADGDGWIDAISFLHSGYGAEWAGHDCYGRYYTDRIWSHKWQFHPWVSKGGVRVNRYHISPAVWQTCGSNIGHIGVIAHETGHFLGLPDLYGSSKGSGIGSWGLMGNSWGFDGSQYYPPALSAWSKIFLGWVTPISITESGTYTAPASYNSPTAFIIETNYPNDEYLLIENRQSIGFDKV